ncbi:hypothetical protein AAH678_27990 [Sodalis endosymbiont of Spalangia cameroni]|uniref:hypothetical protein n=1 Tax=Sodalis praecaptivus TaxID=1239307 RepID=UPI0031F93715
MDNSENKITDSLLVKQNENAEDTARNVQMITDKKLSANIKAINLLSKLKPITEPPSL